MRGLGIARGDAWLGGVCGGLAARLRIDPIIVRGIFVVVALLGFPALLVYAIAWALLPDTDGRIHLRELFHGRYDQAMTGVFILAAVGLVPVVPWLRNVLLWPVWALTGFAPWAWDGGAAGVSALDVLGFLLGVALIGGLVFLIVRSARADRSPWAAAQTASAPPVPGPPVAPHSGDGATSPSAATAAGATDSAGRAPAGSVTGDAATDASTTGAASTDAATCRTTLAAGRRRRRRTGERRTGRRLARATGGVAHAEPGVAAQPAGCRSRGARAGPPRTRSRRHRLRP